MIKPRNLFIILLIAITGYFAWKKLTPKRFNLRAHLAKYNTLKKTLANRQDSLKQNYKQASPSQKKALEYDIPPYLQNTLSQKIFPYWYGTRWDYSGTTAQPRKGKIACGYFVTTTLQHAGFRLNRYYLAQQASSVLIKRLCQKKSIKIIGNNDTKKLITYLKKQPDGLFILGLDTHVGFIEKKQGKLDFIHSSFSTQRRVVREQVINSTVISNSSFYMVGNLLANKQLIRKWVQKLKI